MSRWFRWEHNVSPPTTRDQQDVKDNTEQKVETLMKENQDLREEIESLKKQVSILERGCACYMNNIKWSKKC
jgi:peptidoglycan hydrolase CwlO-like protein